MDYKELLKKYWFILVVAVVLFVFIGVYTVDTISNREVTVKGKTENGQHIVLESFDKTITADELYDKLYESQGTYVAFNALQRAILDKAYKTTDDMNAYANNYAQYVLQNNNQAQIDSFLKQYGYEGISDLAHYAVDMQKYQLLVGDYYKSHYEEVIQPVVEEVKPRIVSHILVKVADVSEETVDGVKVHTANPTDEETAKLNAVLEELKTKPFEEVAKEYSEDGSAAAGGSLGYTDIDKVEAYVEEFKNETMNLNVGTVSDVITTQFGYHIIKVDSVDNVLEEQGFLETLEARNPYLTSLIIIEKAEELGFEIVNEDLLKQINLIKESGAK